MVVLKWLELALNICGMSSGESNLACPVELMTYSASMINILLVLVAVTSRNTANIGILAVALSQAANLCLDLMVFIVEWTSGFCDHRLLSWTDGIVVEMCITSVERIQEYCNLPPQETRPPSGEEWLQHGSIRFNDLTARYRPDLPPAVKGVSFTVKPGQRVGICGRSGSGKSTLLCILWRLIDFDDDGGEIMVDGLDIRELQLSDYRSALSIVPQGTLPLQCGHDVLADGGRSITARVKLKGEPGSRGTTHRRRDMGCSREESCEFMLTLRDNCER